MYQTNQKEFLVMLNCLEIKNGDDFSLDLPRFKKLRDQGNEMKIHENTKVVPNNDWL